MTTRCRETSIWSGPASGCERAPRALDATGIALSERRSQADRSLDGARRGAGGAAAPAAAEHHPLGEVDRDRPRAAGARPIGSGGRPLQADQQRPVRQRLPRVHLSLHAERPHPLDRTAIGVPYQDASNVARWRAGRQQRALPRQHLVHPLRDDPEPRQGPAAPGDFPSARAGVLLRAARASAHHAGDGSVPRPRQQRRRRRAARASTSSASRWTSTTSSEAISRARAAIAGQKNSSSVHRSLQTFSRSE